MSRRTAVLGIAMVWILAIFAPVLVRGQSPTPQEGVVKQVPGTVQPPASGAPSQPAIAVTTVTSPAAPQNPIDQIEWSLAMSFVLRYVTKKRWLSFLTPEATSQIKTMIGFVVAFCTAAGIHLAVNGSPFDGNGASLTITGLSFDAIKDVGFQWVSQQAWYEAIVKKAVTV